MKKKLKSKFKAAEQAASHSKSNHWQPVTVIVELEFDNNSDDGEDD